MKSGGCPKGGAGCSFEGGGKQLEDYVRIYTEGFRCERDIKLLLVRAYLDKCCFLTVVY